ncbi:hypothetical protein NX722_11850 [Endozoicomonas gorgoniicola]|uniref:Uracil-DNA glycosylase-like domain-containing protein n=1 Tax=Endozoicomonas gorgoniicola TaxID=1234144 RepID=A0ABT3MWD6_9GAMM|nr:hypothetical protein [Endozoicomonas gorgoniicola]MCW7553319.1 hypothetical protein [Endozoicomonas gorgoniicola]
MLQNIINHPLKLRKSQKFYGGYNKSAFWKAFRYVQKELKKIYPEKEIAYIWNNISKIGRAGTTGVSPELRSIERNYFPVIRDEVEIIKPDIVLFFTGPNRDHDIKFHFPDMRLANSGSSFTTRQLAKISSTDLPETSIRTYHPAYYGGFTNDLKRNMVQLLTKNPDNCFR